MDSINILNIFERHYKDDTYLNLNPSAKNVTLLLIKHFSATKDLSMQKTIIKAILKPALCMNYFFVENLLDDFAHTTSAQGAECLRIFAWLQNHKFTTKFGVSLPNNLKIHETFVNASLKYSSDTRYFHLAIENYIAAYDTKVVCTNDSLIFTIILTNLENCHRNIHKLLLELFKRLIGCYNAESTHDQQMVNDIIALPWTNRNKHQLLTHLVTIKPELLLNHRQFQLETFLEGIQVGLAFYHLMAPSQSLVKVLHNKEPFKSVFMPMMARLLWEGDELVVKSLIKFWFAAFERSFLERLYSALSMDGKFVNIQTTSAKFYRLLMLRNAFKRTFKDPEVDVKIREFSCTIEDAPMKFEIFHILMDNVYSEGNQLENILSLLNFLQFNMCHVDSNFVDHVMRKLPDFFNLLATRKFRHVDVQQELFAIIRRDIYEHGFELGSYEAVSFSLKLLAIILKQYCGASGNRLSKNTNLEGNLSFRKYLREKQIWDVTSRAIFLQLVKLVDESENSDISEMAVNVIVQHFVMDDFAMEGNEMFVDWIGKKTNESFNHPDIATAHGARRYFSLKFEHALSKSDGVHELLLAVDQLKSRFMKFKLEADPVQSMHQGLHLFNVMDSINYGMKKLDPSEVRRNLIPVMNVLLKLITHHFLDLVNVATVQTSFEDLDLHLTDMIVKSSWQGSSVEETKSKLLLFIWYTLRSSSEMSETLAKVAREAIEPNDKEFSQVMTTCVDVNIQILTRSCHKGAIEAASETLGRITKIVSKQFSKLCNKTTDGARNIHAILVTLKREIDCGKRSTITTGDMRCTRGLILMAHKIIANHPPFLRFLMEALLETPAIESFWDTKLIRFRHDVKPIQLHLLAFLLKDSDLLEEMLRHLDFILLATFEAYKASTDFVMANALLQVIGSIVPKISNQKVECGMERYEPKAVTVYEFYVKFTYAFRIGLFDLKHDRSKLSRPYIIILLEIFSNFEHRNPGEHCAEIEQLRETFQDLMFHECEKIRLLAGRCFAQWLSVDGEMLEIIKNEVLAIFDADGNRIHSTVKYLRTMIERYESCVMFIGDFDSAAFKSTVRHKIAKKFKEKSFVGAINFYIRQHLLDFLLFLGFPFEHEVVQSLMVEKGLKSHFGYNSWVQKVKEIK